MVFKENCIRDDRLVTADVKRRRTPTKNEDFIKISRRVIINGRIEIRGLNLRIVYHQSTESKQNEYIPLILG